MTRLINIQDDDRLFDLEFWQEAGVKARFTAAWQMVKEVEAIRGKDGCQPRLQRSVERIERLRR